MPEKSVMDAKGPEDAFEAILALNMGDFVAEHLISDDLLDKIHHAIGNDPQRLKRQLEELVQIYSLNNTLSLLGFDDHQDTVLFDSIAASLTAMVPVDACHIFQTLWQDDKATFLSLTGTSVSGVSPHRSQLGYPLSDKSNLLVEAYEDGFPAVFEALSSDTPGWTPLGPLGQDNVKALIAVPLKHGLKAMGLMVFECYAPTSFPQEAIDLAEATANVFVVSVHLQKALEKAQFLMAQATPALDEMRSTRAQITELIGDLGRWQQFFVESLAMAIDARNEYTYGHSQGVAAIAKQLAEALGLNEKTVDLVYYAGLLSSLGKINVPQAILTKEEALTPSEMETLKQSPNVGVGILMKMNFLSEVIPYVDYQKERWNGENSPHGLSGKSIPIGARIIAVADAYHALTNPRPYREQPMSSAEALTVLQGEAGVKWDPIVVAALVKMDALSA